MTLSITACQWISETVSWGMFGEAQSLKLVSTIVMVAGLGIRWMAIVTLRSSFSSNVAFRDSQKTKSNGLYRFVRHPSYLGLLLVFLAVGLHSHNWISFALAVVPTTAALLYRIHVEEAALSAAAAQCAAKPRILRSFLTMPQVNARLWATANPVTASIN